jgi:hypothetical protein
MISMEGLLIQQSGLLMVLVCKKQMFLRKIPRRDPVLSHVSSRFLDAGGAYRSCQLLHTQLHIFYPLD